MGAPFTGAFAPSTLLGTRVSAPAANAWAVGHAAVCGGRPAPRHAAAAAAAPPTRRTTTPTALYQTGWAGAVTSAEPRSFTIKVISGSKTQEIEVDSETDLRKALKAANIGVYTLRGKMSNCGGNASCGFCAIEVVEGLGNTNSSGMREQKLLAKKPANYRLACQTVVHGPVTIRNKP
ncbi:hypothetical protein BU14_0513s0003 [Porphyra umbilicalis]|uniref:2Fe-2S ferredoxin-type domain-containing protein n=1 Tax=Porphyra umbilicalis TaxID=2786 RepID=A0A1X6NSQ0_PORUM|nr:hypothetical protein BU14_0513s0003 [Porphyra umbilicalis]|eukprot:OSX71659.1 hypothetical protein BU14_0513s0003 [Porphyra umbilicalis]